MRKTVKTAWEAFAAKHWQSEGAKLVENFDGCQWALIIEESPLYEELNYGLNEGAYEAASLGCKVTPWAVHTAFMNAFKGTGYHPEMKNSCVVGFYRD